MVLQNMSTPMLSTNQMTKELCIEICRTTDQLAAIMIDACFCLNEYDFIAVPKSFCTGSCAGNAQQNCGADEAFVSVHDPSEYATQDLSSCHDAFKKGLVPMTEHCVHLVDSEDNILRCCWNKLFQPKKVSKTSIIIEFDS